MEYKQKTLEQQADLMGLPGKVNKSGDYKSSDLSLAYISPLKGGKAPEGEKRLEIYTSTKPRDLKTGDVVLIRDRNEVPYALGTVQAKGTGKAGKLRIEVTSPWAGTIEDISNHNADIGKIDPILRARFK